MTGTPLLRHAGAVLAGLLLAGVAVQLPLLPVGGGESSFSSVAVVGARFLGVSPERIGYDPTGFLTLRKMATAAVFSIVAAFLWGLGRGDAPRPAIPPLSAQTAAVVRVALAAGLIWAFLHVGPVEPAFPRAFHRDAGPLADWPWLHHLAEHTRATIWIHRAMLGAVLVFALGLCTRLAVLGVAALTTLHTLVLLQRQSAHDWGLPVVALWLLALVPWGDALSVDAAWRRFRGNPPLMRSPAEYGLAVWIPGVALGVAWLAAAFAKMDSGGLAWITGGAVRYHFVTDANQAPGDWGLRVAGNLTLARLASLGGVLVEALFILHVFFSNWRVRLVFGFAGAALLYGFLQFQGVFWAMWWVLLLAFVPWQELTTLFGGRLTLGRLKAAPTSGLVWGPPSGDPTSGWIKPWQVAVLGAFALQQVVFSGIRLEIEPLMSDYAMYSSTFGSTTEFDDYLASKRRTLRFEATDAPTIDIAERLADLPKATDILTLTLVELRRSPALAPDTRDALRTVVEAYEGRYHEPMPRLHVQATEPRFDWQRGRFAPPTQIDYGIVDFATVAAR
jgi:hypothetical protein